MNGEQLGLDIADGLHQIIGTVTGSFVVYLREVISRMPSHNIPLHPTGLPTT